jgi:hypothetical protein
MQRHGRIGGDRRLRQWLHQVPRGARGSILVGTLLAAVGAGAVLERLPRGLPAQDAATGGDGDVLSRLLHETPESAEPTTVNAPAPAAPAPPDAAPAPPPAPAGPAASLSVRVGLVSQGLWARVGGTGGWRCGSEGGEVHPQTAGRAVPAASLLAGRGSGLICRSDPGGSLTVNGRSYPGDLALHRDGQGIRVVNRLSMEQYVAGVVGSEMPASWNGEALKAQAVAARSYALAHMARPASPLFHLGDTTRWQAYRGLEGMHPRTLTATRATAGQILSYRGGIVESLYAATDAISLEAHGHLGASMSQHGAQDLANQGWSYRQILGRYYPGASLARLTSRGVRAG